MIGEVFIEDDTLNIISNNTDGRGTSQQNENKLYRIPRILVLKEVVPE